MFTIAKLDRYDIINNPMSKKPAFTIWFSGCHFHCKNCQNIELLDSNFGTQLTMDELYNIVSHEYNSLDLHDVVLLGGEPLDQLRGSLIKLLKLFSNDGKRIWLYTGYEFEEISDDIKKYLYTIKCGRYIDDLRDEQHFPITKNQRVFRNAGGWKQINL